MGRHGVLTAVLVTSTLRARLGAESPHRIVLITGHAGCGKTTAIAAAVAEGVPAHHLRADRFTTTLVPFVRSLADQLGASVPEPAMGLAGATASSRNVRDRTRALGTWFASALGSQHRIIALDDLHLVEQLPVLRDFVVRAVEASHASVKWILASREATAWPVAWWMARSMAGMPLVMPPRTHAVDDERLAASSRTWLASLAETEREVATALALLPAFDARHLAAIDGAAAVMEALRAVVPDAVAAQTMRAACAATLADAHDTRTVELAARALRSTPHGLLQLFASVDDRLQIVRTLDCHGFALLDSGHGDVVESAIERLTPAERRACPVALMLEAKHESALGRHDVAEAWYLHAADNALDSVTQARILLAHGSDLNRRARPDAVEMLERVIAVPISLAADASALATLAGAYAQAERQAEALETLAPALRWAESPGDVGLPARALIFRQASYVYLRCADSSTASNYAERAILVASTCGLDEIVALARSVLVAVAAQHDDDPNAPLDHLRELEECARRLENEYLIRYALLAQIDAYGELADWPAVDRIERILGDLELENDALHVDETLVRVRAMRAAASGEFAGAYAQLGSAKHFATDPDMRALRCSELALYAAAGYTGGYGDAVKQADLALEQSPTAESAMCVRAMLHLAAAAHVAGEREAAQMRLRKASSESATYPRLDALRAAISALLSFDSDEDEAAALDFLSALADLRARGLGGTAASLAMLPGTTPERLELAS